MPTLTIDGTNYNIRRKNRFSLSDLRMEIQNPQDTNWYLLKAYAIVREANGIYVMPIKSHIDIYTLGPPRSAYLGGLPNMVGGNVESGNTIQQTLNHELREETHGQWEQRDPNSNDQFIDLLFVPVPANPGRNICYAFYTREIRATGTRIAQNALTQSMREMTGEHLRFSTDDVIEAINSVSLTDRPTPDKVKTAILFIYNSSNLPATVRAHAVAQNNAITDQVFDQWKLATVNQFQSESHTINCLASYISAQIEATGRMEQLYNTKIREKFDQMAAHKEWQVRRQRAKYLRILGLSMIVLVFAYILGKWEVVRW